MKTKSMSLIPLLTVLLIICSWITIPIGPVPITLQTFGVFLIAFIAPATIALGSSLLYLILGLIGFPVFAGGVGGLATIASPTFGFALSFPIVMYFIARFTQNHRLKTFPQFFSLGVLASIFIYLIGIPYMILALRIVSSIHITLGEALAIGMFPFLMGDTLKIAFAAALAVRLRPILNKMLTR
ncbi:biotin transporter BioY [Fundicoccus culcitae]|uniref:Biotin transporter n=1 Tax=Fundicoccus culcitae TaxID=2969821 RepID=A0ABY5P2P7_9LACT|nr:biotin transporter BioY [Fundicoccus culcitae]UUX32993.1 biotin transporter BioY [Fundicoccus culcitae]